jgi:hypothetical protein
MVYIHGRVLRNKQILELKKYRAQDNTNAPKTLDSVAT